MGQISLFDSEEFVKDEVFVFFDTETNGLPYDFNAPATEVDNWPRMIQLAWIQADAQQHEISRGNYLIYPENFYIYESVHGITHERALKEGHDLLEVLQKFARVVKESTVLVAHNISFDDRVLGAEFIRKGLPNPMKHLNRICTMETTVDYVAIKSGQRNKFPKLEELHQRIFGTGFEGAHNAMMDVEALARCFWELKKNNIISLY